MPIVGEERPVGHEIVTVCPELRVVPLGEHVCADVGNPTEFTPELCGET